LFRSMYLILFQASKGRVASEFYTAACIPLGI
jgi:hypothetical protein